jgi:23S rRNA (cytosine1962-C5)-methyltransferase
LEEKISNTKRQINVLNLFAYTGLASLAAAHAGARVTHVDSAKRAISLARHNQSLSGLEDKPIRWIVDDALKFTQREIRRGVKYDAIIMDPPKYGLGPNKERWEFYKLFPELCQACRSVLSEKPLFIIVTTYGIELAPDELAQYVSDMLFGFRGDLEMGELITKEKSAGRILSKAIYVRWCAKDAG